MLSAIMLNVNMLIAVGQNYSQVSLQNKLCGSKSRIRERASIEVKIMPCVPKVHDLTWARCVSPWWAFQNWSNHCEWGQDCLPKSVSSERDFTRVGSGLTNKHLTKLEKLAWDKHSSLLRQFVNYDCKKFYNIVPWLQEKNQGTLIGPHCREKFAV